MARHLLSRVALAAIVLLLLPGVMTPARAAEANPLAVPDASSPRAALQGFLAETDSIYARWADLMADYLHGGTLYLTPGQKRVIRDVLNDAPNAGRILDLSGVPPILRPNVGQERTLQFREILDRIPLPDPADIPDATAMAKQTAKRWRLPGTEIEFVQIPQGPRAGDYVLSPATVERLPEFYDRVKDLPYKPGAGRRLIETYHDFDPASANSIYDIFIASPVGLAVILPMRWMLAWPSWTRAHVGGATVWQWIGLAIGAGLCAGLLWLSRRLAVRLSAQPEESLRHRWHLIPVPAALLLIAGLALPALCAFLRIGGTPRIMIEVLETTMFYGACAWLALSCCAVAGETIAGAEGLALRTLDGQLVRLASRLVGVMLAIGFLVEGADSLGIPAYSVLAGLGVGGLAVALAAKDSLANLLGSLLIMFEKPFRVGHHIRLAGHEGTVEDVGFRSTRIRTPDNSLISIPNDSVINTMVENLSLRPMRRQRFRIGLPYTTPRVTLDAFTDGVRRLIHDHELTEKDGIRVSLSDLTDKGLDILIVFHLQVPDSATELQARHEILLRVMALAEEMGLSFT
ncbi:MAG TPA: mechanosensitive ion channel family protein [Rhodopila sp.]|nr:mechanosensitive ion channel family protein [Rhodopila sp.]